MNKPKIVSPLGFTPKPDLNSDPDSQWDNILGADEKILWQGRPDGAFTFSLQNSKSLLGGLGFSGFAIFWMMMASNSGGNFWMFGLIHFCMGLGMAFGPAIKDAITRRYTWYTLTNTRAIIATALPVFARTLKSYEITRETVIDFRATAPATIYFAEREIYSRNKKLRTIQIGFQRIENGEEVYRLIRDIQKDTA